MTPIHNQQQQKKVSKTNFWVFLVTAYNTREEESKKNISIAFVSEREIQYKAAKMTIKEMAVEEKPVDTEQSSERKPESEYSIYSFV